MKSNKNPFRTFDFSLNRISEEFLISPERSSIGRGRFVVMNFIKKMKVLAATNDASESLRTEFKEKNDNIIFWSNPIYTIFQSVFIAIEREKKV